VQALAECPQRLADLANDAYAEYAEYAEYGFMFEASSYSEPGTLPRRVIACRHSPRRLSRAGQVRHLAPHAVEVDADVRTEAVVAAEFVASIVGRGVLQGHVIGRPCRAAA
jgi:hypothetical protein